MMSAANNTSQTVTVTSIPALALMSVEDIRKAIRGGSKGATLTITSLVK